MQKQSKATQNSIKTNQDVNLYSLRETAEKLAVGYRSVQQLVYDRKLAHIRIGKRVLISADAINEYVNKYTVQAV